METISERVHHDIQRIYSNPQTQREILGASHPSFWQEKAKQLRSRLHLPMYWNPSTFDEDWCFQYVICLDEDKSDIDGTVPWLLSDVQAPVPEPRQDHRAWLYISVLAPYYSYDLTQRDFEPGKKFPRQRLVSEFGSLPGYPEQENVIRTFLDSQNYQLLDDEVLRQPVPGVSVEDSTVDITVLKCLFFTYS